MCKCSFLTNNCWRFDTKKFKSVIHFNSKVIMLNCITAIMYIIQVRLGFILGGLGLVFTLLLHKNNYHINYTDTLGFLHILWTQFNPKTCFRSSHFGVLFSHIRCCKTVVYHRPVGFILQRLWIGKKQSVTSGSGVTHTQLDRPGPTGSTSALPGFVFPGYSSFLPQSQNTHVAEWKLLIAPL